MAVCVAVDSGGVWVGCGDITMNPKRLFLTGIPTGGKSYLGKKLAEKVGGICVSTDDMREELSKDPQYKEWIEFYLNQDEHAYYTTKNYDEQWDNLVKQSEVMWPGVLEKILEYEKEGRPVIFEGVNLLPHLIKRDFNIPGLVIIGKSLEDVFNRCKSNPRWGNTEELWKLEADAFFNGERPRYKREAEKYGYEVFESADEAMEFATSHLI